MGYDLERTNDKLQIHSKHNIPILIFLDQWKMTSRQYEGLQNRDTSQYSEDGI